MRARLAPGCSGLYAANPVVAEPRERETFGHGLGHNHPEWWFVARVRVGTAEAVAHPDASSSLPRGVVVGLHRPPHTALDAMRARSPGLVLAEGADLVGALLKRHILALAHHSG
jgi:hypothetical protein